MEPLKDYQKQLIAEIFREKPLKELEGLHFKYLQTLYDMETHLEGILELMDKNYSEMPCGCEAYKTMKMAYGMLENACNRLEKGIYEL